MTLPTVIKITGIDTNRPPRIRKEAYIDLYYQLSEAAPEEWCEDFNALGRQVNPQAKIDKNDPGFVSTYINDMEEIPRHFGQIKQAIADCNKQYLEKITQRQAALARDNAALQEQGGQQFRLNEIVAALDFET
jgi:hypothetical protein